jgi:enediyne biosynthesis protein E3
MRDARASSTAASIIGAGMRAPAWPLRVDLSPTFRRLRRMMLGIETRETSFERRGFRWRDRHARDHLERVGRTFLLGYHVALDDDRPTLLERHLASIPPVWRGFAFEGAAMALVLRDSLAPWRPSRFRAFLTGPGAPHAYMVLVGCGWAIARLRRSPAISPAGADPLLRWLVVDGFGFHEGYFRWPAIVTQQRVPTHLSGYARRAFDQGLGRALWFVNGADPSLVEAAIARFPEHRRGDLWSGLGLACTYAGGADQDGLRALRIAAGPWRPELAQGAAFAAEARRRASTMTPHTDLACRVLGDLPAWRAADLVNRARLDLPPDGPEPAYEVWRRRIQSDLWTED